MNTLKRKEGCSIQAKENKPVTDGWFPLGPSGLRMTDRWFRAETRRALRECGTKYTLEPGSRFSYHKKEGSDLRGPPFLGPKTIDSRELTFYTTMQ